MADEIVERTLPPNEQHEWQAKAVAAGWKPPWHDESGRTPSREMRTCPGCGDTYNRAASGDMEHAQGGVTYCCEDCAAMNAPAAECPVCE